MAGEVDPSKPPPLTNEKPSAIVPRASSTVDQHVTFTEEIVDLLDSHDEEEDEDEGEVEDEEEEDEEEDEWDPCLALGEDEDLEQQYFPWYCPSEEKIRKCLRQQNKKFPKQASKRPWYLQKKRTLLEKRQDSTIVFVMPKQEDPEVIALRRTNKMVQKLIKYMKKSWKVRINRKQEERELEHRSLVSVYTRKPDNWLDLVRARENRALETGFFSGMDVPFEALIDLELDPALLTFKNLPDDLKITAARWIRMRLRKEELKKKRDANLPRLPHGRTQRPSYNKGRLIKDPGGVQKVDQFVKVAEGFHKVSRGNTTFSKVLKQWVKKRETESSSKNTGFGMIREGMFDFSGKEAHTMQAKADDAADNADRGSISIIDARKYQREMLYFAKVLSAIYIIVKSILNIKIKQLESKFPLPPTAILQLRSKSPDKMVVSRAIPNAILERNEKMKARKLSDTELDRGRSKVGMSAQEAINLDKERRLSMIGRTPSRKSVGDINAKSPSNEEVDRVVSKDKLRRLSVSRSKEIRGEKDQIDGVKKGISVSLMNINEDKKDANDDEDDMDYMSEKLALTSGKPSTVLSAEQKIKRLSENPDHAAVRRARNFMTYTKIFERNKKLKTPVWHNIDIAAMALDFNLGPTGPKDPANLTEEDAAEIAEKALEKRRMMTKKSEHANEETEKRWPEEYDIPTPIYPFPKSAVKIPSEEQSRINLLKKTPHIDEVPSTPVRRLYKLAGVRTVEGDIFNNIMEMKKMFRVTENKLRVYYENEIGKWDWDTLRRFRGKLHSIKAHPVYHVTITDMRSSTGGLGAPASDTSVKTAEDDASAKKEEAVPQKRPALWYKRLQEEAENNGATRHNGCVQEMHKLMKYCDVDMKTKPYMLNRLALFTVSLPTTELGTKHWQEAIVFLLEHMCGTPPEIIHEWLKYRCLPYLL